jgi:cellulose synthase/poly-beta-1,6-N-acetylglucosamine synthase-like glycosyltransferase
MLLVHGALVLAALALVVAALVLAIECLAACLPLPPPPAAGTGARPRVAVVVPAHDEAGDIGACLAALVPQLGARDRLVVVADDCRDATAARARAAGATVLERCDPARVGKGYALAHAVDFLAGDPPDVVVMIDADCRAGAGLVERVACLATASGRPVQATYLLAPPATPSPYDLLSALAVVIKNDVRPRGLARLGLPCPLAGSGMAFPWEVVRGAPLASGQAAEDVELTARLVRTGCLPLLCADVSVTGCLPAGRAAARSQRRRWEHGHLDVVLRHAPALLGAGLAARRPATIALALDLCVPPLALFAVLWTVLAVAALVHALLAAAWLPVALLGSAGVLVAAAVAVAWVGFARPLVPASALLAVPGYVLWKLPLYAALLTRRQTRWTRSRRRSSRR